MNGKALPEDEKMMIECATANLALVTTQSRMIKKYVKKFLEFHKVWKYQVKRWFNVWCVGTNYQEMWRNSLGKLQH